VKSQQFKFIAASAILALTQCVALPAMAADYPSAPIHLMVPFPPGGGTDTLARILSKDMSGSLHGNIIAENKPGAGTLVGSDYVARSKPDGYTILLTTSAHAINASLYKKLPYSVEKSFASIGLVGSAPMVVVVRPDSPYKTIKDIATYATANPGKLTYGSSGTGTAVHLAAELFKSIAHVNLTHVPYRGASPAMTDLMGGQIDMFFGTSGAVAPFVKAGKLRAIAVTTAQPSPSWPGVPTIASAGYPEYAAEVWYALFAPAGTPPDIVARLNKAMNDTVKSDDFVKGMASEGLSSPQGTPAQLDKYVAEEVARWHKVIVDGNIETQ
jgi:tripartite-type tricarboxylate transporter receptor subunit TctC